MTVSLKRQRIRDPLHNLIEFGSHQFEHTLWQVIKTPAFQRLRRIRQLGFSEFVFPGATHSRFAHSIGVFHTARQLMQMISRYIAETGRQFGDHQAQVALAASLVHDVGHGMFSHAFEEIGKKLELSMAHHETVGELLIRDSEISAAFRELGGGFANDVADVIKGGPPRNLYDTVVSSQFDADRLDYMQRDRMMTGVQSSGIDATWLMANLEIASVPIEADSDAAGKIETLVLGPKAFHAAENYVLSLFQLYPNVYLHKATRAAEKVFSALMLKLILLERGGHGEKSGLPRNHPIRRFASEPNKLTNALALDDAVFMGALPMIVDADDPSVADCARRLQERRLPKCIDIRRRIEQEMPAKTTMDAKSKADRDAKVRLHSKKISERLESWSSAKSQSMPRILVDQAKRTPYKKFQDSQSLLNQILIRQGQRVLDMAEISPVVASAETYEVCRAYVIEDDNEAKRMVENEIGTSLTEPIDVKL